MSVHIQFSFQIDDMFYNVQAVPFINLAESCHLVRLCVHTYQHYTMAAPEDWPDRTAY